METFFVCIHVVHPYSSIYTATPLKKSHFISSEGSNHYMINNLPIAVHAFTMRSVSVDEILQLKYVNCYTSFTGLPLKVEIAPSVLSAFT